MSTEKEKIHSLALKRYKRVEKKERDQRKLAVEDIKFAQTEDGQWDEGAKAKRANRPRYTINRVAGAIDQLIGDQRQNRTDMKVRPTSGGSTEDTAKVMEGLIRNIESTSKASNAYDTAFDEVVNGGFGGWRIITERDEDDPFIQNIKIKSINTATTSLWFDDSSTEYDKNDSKWAFNTVDMPTEEHRERFPGSPSIDWPQEKLNSSQCNGWFREGIVKVAEYWVKIPKRKQIALLSDGRIIDAEEEKSVLDELSAQGVTVKKTIEVESHDVKMYLMDGSGILEDAKDWAGKFIPLIPMFGRQSHIEGKTYTRGLVRFAKDANRIYNYATTTVIETIALSPKDPIWYTPTQALGHETKYANFNTSNSPFMPFNPDLKFPGPPTRGGAPAVQSSLIQQVQQASMDIYHVTGMQPPSLGANPELKSGKAIQAQERLGDRGSYVFTDNKLKSQQYTAEILLDLVPRIYDTARQVRIMGRDGETESVEINAVNQEITDEQTGESNLVNDLAFGRYGVVAESGPAFATQRQESAEQIIELITRSPRFEALAMDLVAKDLPILERKELVKRIRKQMIVEGTVEPTEEEIQEFGLDQEQAPDPQQEAITDNINMQTTKLMSDIESQDAKTTQTTIETQKATIEAYEKLIDAFKKQVESGIPLTEDDHDIRVKQQDIIIEGQQSIDEGPNREQAADIVQGAVQQEQQADIDSARRLTVEQPSASAGQDNL
jgi:hypothetical protein